jgi:glycosyltransferase involved in cell wall biosynthesis
MGNHLEFSVVVTVLNEAGSVEPLLHSLVNQTLQPREIVIVDAGSNDGTIEKIIAFKHNEADVVITVFEELRVNRSKGRNYGIKKARYAHIAVTDAGCVADKDWLLNLSSGFASPKVQTVAGFYKVVAINQLERVFSWFLAVTPDVLNTNTFLPSSRSIAFTKQAWDQVGGYPEELITCEDLIYARNLTRLGTMVVKPDALVTWNMPHTFYAFFNQVAGYAAGDVEARYRPHLKKHGLIWLRYLLFVIYPLFLLIYPFWPILKHRKRITNVAQAIWLVPVQVVTDVAIMWGGLRGLRC